jgi:transcriptional regulator with XRE-family HTH domain
MSTVICALFELCYFNQKQGGAFVNFYENFVWMCNGVGKTPSKVAREVGVSKSIVSRWKNGGGVTDATASKLASYFNVPLDVMKGEAPGSNIQEKKPADQKADGLRGTGYYDLTPENQKVIDSLIETLLNSQSRG